MNDVGLMNREHWVARQVRLVGHHPVPVNRDQFRGGRHQVTRDLQRLSERAGSRSPFLEPKLVVLDIEQDALPRLVEPIAQLRFVAEPPVGEPRAAGQGSLEELAQVVRELELEPALDGDDFGIGQTGVELQSIITERNRPRPARSRPWCRGAGRPVLASYCDPCRPASTAEY